MYATSQVTAADIRQFAHSKIAEIDHIENSAKHSLFKLCSITPLHPQNFSIANYVTEFDARLVHGELDFAKEAVMGAHLGTMRRKLTECTDEAIKGLKDMVGSMASVPKEVRQAYINAYREVLITSLKILNPIKESINELTKNNPRDIGLKMTNGEYENLVTSMKTLLSKGAAV